MFHICPWPCFPSALLTSVSNSTVCGVSWPTMPWWSMAGVKPSMAIWRAIGFGPFGPCHVQGPCSVWWLLNVVDSYSFSYFQCGMKLPFVHLRFTFGWLNNPEFNDGLWPSLSWFDTCRLVNLAFRVIDGYRFWHKGWIYVGYVRRSMLIVRFMMMFCRRGRCDDVWCQMLRQRQMDSDAKCAVKPFWWSCKLLQSNLGLRI